MRKATNKPNLEARDSDVTERSRHKNAITPLTMSLSGVP